MLLNTKKYACRAVNLLIESEQIQGLVQISNNRIPNVQQVGVGSFYLLWEFGVHPTDSILYEPSSFFVGVI